MYEEETFSAADLGLCFLECEDVGGELNMLYYYKGIALRDDERITAGILTEEDETKRCK